MLGTDRDPVVIDEMLVPPERWGVRCISIGYFVPEGQAVIWRGPMLHKALEQFLTDVFWDEPDFLLDRHAARHRRHRPLAQPSTCRAARCTSSPPRSPPRRRWPRCRRRWPPRSTCRSSGVIENMSWFTGDDGKRYEIFGSGGGQVLADELGVPLLGQLPLVPALREGGDDGRPITAVDPDSPRPPRSSSASPRDRRRLKPKKVFSDKLKVI